MRESISGIYSIKNVVNEKRYIGQSTDVHHRFVAHRSCLRRGVHYNKHLQNAWNKYGEECFEFSVIEICESNQLDDREKYYIDLFNAFKNGYNETEGGDGIQGHKMSDDARKHMSESHCHLYGSNHPSSKPIVLINTGEVFGSVLDAANTYGVCHSDISANAKHKLRSAGSNNGKRLVWSYMDDYVSMTEDEKLKLLYVAQNCKRGAMHYKCRRVKCLDTGETFYSIRDASMATGIHEASISCACRGAQQRAGGYAWAYCDKE